MDEVGIRNKVRVVLEELCSLKCISDITYEDYLRLVNRIPSCDMKDLGDVGSISRAELARYIDHTLLKPDASVSDIKNLCQEAVRFGFKAVCVNPCWVGFASEILSGTDIQVATVIGFPLGANAIETKVFESKTAKDHGADEFDMVMNIGALKSGDVKLVFEDIKSVVQAVFPCIVKVIIETVLLTDEEKVMSCAISKLAGAHFVKTSTGFAKGGATVDDVKLMKLAVGNGVEVKASGGIRDFETAIEMIKAGATRIGTSSGVSIVEGSEAKSFY